MPDILGRYIVREILALLLPIWGALGFILYVLEWLAQVFNLKVGAGTTLLLYLYKVPSHLQLVFPIAVLFACLAVLGAMNRSREIVAAQAMGRPLNAILFPVLLAVSLACIPYYLVVNHLAPWGMTRHYELMDTEVKKQPSRFSKVRQEKIWYRNQDVLYNVGYFDPTKNELHDVTLYTFDEKFQIVQTIRASRAHWSGREWLLEDGSISLVDPTMAVPAIQKFAARTTRLMEDPTALKRVEFNAETMTQGELYDAITRHRALGINTAQWEVIYHSRYTFFLISFVFVLLAFPRAIRFSRSGGTARDGVFVAGVCLLYWLMYTFGSNLGNSGRLNPAVAVWTPALIFMVGVIIYNRTLNLRSTSD